MEATKFLVLNSHIQGSFKKCWLLFSQAKMVLVVVWLFYHFTLKSTPSLIGVWMIELISHLHVWVTKFKSWLMFFKVPMLTSNNVVWVSLLAVLFDEI